MTAISHIIPAVLTEAAVSRLMSLCLCEDGASAESGVIVEGVESNFAFDPVALQTCRSQIAFLLKELPDPFRDTNEKAGCWSFLNAVEDRHGNRWASAHLFVEALVALGLATGMVTWTRPRQDWTELPGGFPFITIITAALEPVS